MMRPLYKSLPICLGLLFASAAWSDDEETAQGAEKDSDFQQEVRDAWIDGKLEGAYTFNRHLNPFAIETDVENGVVTLSGTVESEIDRDLAGEIARGLDGVTDVQNNLMVDADYEGDREAEHVADQRDAEADTDDSEAQERRSFGRWVDDATTTASVKTRLIGNSNIRARDIDVDTSDDVVTLRGEVRTDEEKDLAEAITKNVPEVREVRNELRVSDAG